MASLNESAGPIGVLRSSWNDVVLDLFEPLMRDDIVLGCLHFCRVRPIKMPGAPEFGPENPHQASKVADFALSMLQRAPQLEAIGGLPASWSAEKKERYVRYARDRVAFVLDWVAKHPAKYGRIVMNGAYSMAGEGYTEAQMWRALRVQFKEYDGQPINEETLRKLSDRAYLSVSHKPFGARK